MSVEHHIQYYVNGITAGNIAILSKAITLVESTLPTHQQLAAELVEACLPFAQQSIRIGITGVPGVGKSSFIEKFGLHLINQHQKKVAVLAIDPSSAVTGGSILGDKTRMEHLAVHPNAYIRPTPTGQTLGGVSHKTRETIYLCEAAGFDTIIVETVGVGQSETMVHSMVDFFLLLMLAGAGDELQGIKRGIMEMADALVITKADGDNLTKAKLAATEYKRALHFMPPQAGGWQVPTSVCSAVNNLGLDEVWQQINNYKQTTTQNNYFTQKRNQQAVYWLEQTLNHTIMQLHLSKPSIKTAYEKYKNMVSNGTISSYKACDELIKLILS